VTRQPAITVVLAAALIASVQASSAPGAGTWTQSATASGNPVFRSSVDLVSVTAVVRDRNGRLVRDLERDDFEVFDAGVRRPIVEFAPAEDGPVSLAVLFDTSGSMRVTDNLEAGRLVVAHLLAVLRPDVDEIAFYAFDSGLRAMQVFTTDHERVRRALPDLEAFGSTALYDAIGTVAAQLDERPHRRRALVVVTDGVDTSSQRSPADVSGVASASDVPVYVVTVGTGEKDTLAGPVVAFEPAPVTPGAHLGNLAHWTGGALFNGRGPAAAAVTARALLAELRHQYLLAFESAGPGWRPVDVRLRRSQVTVRTRSAYQSGRPIG
jgi:Ca-activated chloride channel family protein